MTTRTRGRRATGWTLILVGVAALLWCGYWFASSQVAASAAERLIASLAAGGRAVSCETNTTGGFPLSLDLDCGQATFSDERAGMTVALSRVKATAPLYWPGSVSAAVAAPMAFDVPGQGVSLQADWTSALATAEAGLSGLTRVAVTLDGLSLQPKAGTARLPFTLLAGEHAEIFAEPAAGNAYRFFLVADDIRLKPRKGKEYPPIAAAADLKARDFGGSLGTDPARAVRAWLAAGGAIDVSRLALSLGGASMIAEGTLQLSPQGLLSGNLTVHMAGLNKLPQAMDRIKPGSGDKVAQAIAAASMFTKPVDGDKNAREAPVTIRDGVVAIGMIPVATIPPLRL